MKKLLYLFVAILFIAFTACDDDDDEPRGAGKTLSKYIEATSSSTWHYFSFKDTTVVGSGAETEADNAAWFARTDWDIAIRKYHVRTNSRGATSVGSQGGVFTCPENVSYAALETVPDTAVFAADKMIPVAGHGGTSDVMKSTAQVIQFKMEWDTETETWKKVMPPVYLQSPVYIFKTADGKDTYKLNFTQYEKEGTSGHVKFDFAILY